MTGEAQKTELPPVKLDDDTFAYDGGMFQCIRGFGRNAKSVFGEFLEWLEQVADVPPTNELREARERID